MSTWLRRVRKRPHVLDPASQKFSQSCPRSQCGRGGTQNVPKLNLSPRLSLCVHVVGSYGVCCCCCFFLFVCLFVCLFVWVFFFVCLFVCLFGVCFCFLFVFSWVFFVCLLFFFAFPSYISGVHHFWVRFLRI